MAVTGVPESQPHHAHAMADFAMDIMEEAARVTSPATGLPLKVGGWGGRGIALKGGWGGRGTALKGGWVGR